MDEELKAERAIEAELRALRADNEHRRLEVLKVRDRALELAQRCDTLERERDALRAQLAMPARKAWPFRLLARSR